MNVNFDPYSALHITVPSIAAFCAGRCFGRLSWHAQQAILLGRPRGVPTYDLATRKAHEHFEQSCRIYDSLTTLSYELGSGDAVATEIAQLRANWTEPTWWVILADEIAAFVDDVLCEDKTVGEVCRFLVDSWFSPDCARLWNLLLKSVPAEHQPYLRLGRLLEEGICRPDVSQFLCGPARDVLTQDAVSKALHNELDNYDPMLSDDETPREKTDFEASIDREAADEDCAEEAASFGRGRRAAFPLCHSPREPADLAPALDWFGKFRAAWDAAKLQPDELKPLEDVYTKYLSRQLTAQVLESNIDTLHHHVMSALAPDNDEARLTVSEDFTVVTMDGQDHQVDPEVGYVFHALLEAGGQMPFNQIPASAPDNIKTLFEGVRLERLKKRMPSALAACLRSAKGKPLRLELPSN